MPSLLFRIIMLHWPGSRAAVRCEVLQLQWRHQRVVHELRGRSVSMLISKDRTPFCFIQPQWLLPLRVGSIKANINARTEGDKYASCVVVLIVASVVQTCVRNATANGNVEGYIVLYSSIKKTTIDLW